MPIYEFYCADCNTIFNFFSRRVNTEKRPICPKCKKCPLERLISKVTFLKGVREQDETMLSQLDEANLGKAMSLLQQESSNMDEDNPRQVAQIMRKMCDVTGMNLGRGMEEALRRIGEGEDPEKIEEELGDFFKEEELFTMSPKSSQISKKKPPARNDTLYNL